MRGELWMLLLQQALVSVALMVTMTVAVAGAVSAAAVWCYGSNIPFLLSGTIVMDGQ